jgi:hypothetical protein
MGSLPGGIMATKGAKFKVGDLVISCNQYCELGLIGKITGIANNMFSPIPYYNTTFTEGMLVPIHEENVKLYPASKIEKIVWGIDD